MPDNSSNQAAMQAGGHSLQIHLVFLRGAVVLAGTVTATPTFPATSVSYTLDSGDIADVERGYRVVFYTSAGAYKGVAHVRWSGALSSSTLAIRETSKGYVDITSGDTFEVRSIIQPGDKLVEASEFFRPDGLVYVDQTGADAPPVACSGGPFAAFVDAGQSYATVTFKGDESYTVAADSSGALTHSWSAATATGTTSSTDANPTFTFPVGEHVVKHTVTDSTNGEAWTQFVNGAVFDNDNPPYGLTAEDFQLEADEENGWYVTFGVFDELDTNTVPDGTLTVVFCRERMNGTEQSFRNTWSGRRNILFAGYLDNDQTSMSGEDGVENMVMTAQSPLMYFRRVIAYSKVGLDTSSPDAWSEIADQTVLRIAWHIARFYTWMTEAWDFVAHDNFSDAAYPAFYITERNPVDQIAQLADSRNGRLVCDRAGRFEIHTRLELLPRATRDTQTTALVLGNGDMMNYEMDRQHWRPLEFYRTQGITAGSSGNVSAFARWPGEAPGYGTAEGKTEKLIVDSRAQNYQWCGFRGARVNRDYQLSTGALLHAPRIRIVLPGSYDIFDPAYPEWIEFEAGACPNLRGVDVSAFRWLVRQVSWDPEKGTSRLEVDLEAETYGASGVDDTPPDEGDNGLGDWTSPGNNWDFDLLPEVVPPVFGWDQFPLDAVPAKSILLGTGTAQVARAYELPASGGAVFEVINTGVTGVPLWLRSDPYDYRRKFLTTTTGLFRCDNAWEASPTWTLVHAPSDFPSMGVGHYPHIFQMSINLQGFMYFTSGNQGYRSYDYGQTLTGPYMMGVELGAFTAAGSHSIFDISHYNEGLMVSTNFEGWPGWASGYRYSVSKSLDWGATWTTLVALIEYANTSPGPGPSALIPYQRWNGAANNNADGNFEWWYKSQKKMVQYAGLAGAGGVASASYAGSIAPVPYSALTVTSGQRAYGTNVSGIFRIDPPNVVVGLTGAPVGGSRCSLQGFGMNPNIVFAYADNVVNGAHLSFDAGATWTLVGSNGWLPRYMELDLSDYIPPA